MNRSFEKRLQFYTELIEYTKDLSPILEIEYLPRIDDFDFYISLFYPEGRCEGLDYSYPFSFEYLSDWMTGVLGLTTDIVDIIWSRFEKEDFLVYPKFLDV